MAYTHFKLTSMAVFPARTLQAVQRLACLFLFLAGSGCAPRPAPHPLASAAAADLSFAMEELSRQFAGIAPGTRLEVAYGSSGTFFAQLQNGAPFDLFLSADLAYPRQLAAKGIGAGNSLFTYGAGRLVVWVPATSPLDPAAALNNRSWKHLAIANPQHAPYGRAAEAALRGMGLYDQVSPKLVLGENVAQALQFVESGAADVGIVALSLALAPATRALGRYWELPLDSYPPMEQGGMIIRDTAEARAFRAFLLSPAGRRILKQYGFYSPGE